LLFSCHNSEVADAINGWSAGLRRVQVSGATKQNLAKPKNRALKLAMRKETGETNPNRLRKS
jgi:hypothetical protein